MNTKKKSDVIKAEQTASKKTAPVKGQEVKSGKAMVWLAALIALVGIVAYYYFEDVNALYAFGALIAGIAIGAGVFFVSPSGKNLVVFFKEARMELRRVVWPSMDETRKMTILVVIVMVITLLFLMFVDFIIKNIISFILSFS
ncbi:preprotein translocase subunit SecE [Ignatzschineria rhizosphaerae]|uniref:Protein translocase subunit SecE n=1 Tax=Ignatzschineria rhizosphaerae TaxID=2923279 RepID=A0ABY3X050_9GAMM|nr:preprotein translocase subunit SecE [Ignatzschineria rhizosphaerae]UNM96239.1 preprotein translocase subunit SecE [Ignatzschineria rhizosphaerae]